MGKPYSIWNRAHSKFKKRHGVCDRSLAFVGMWDDDGTTDYETIPAKIIRGLKEREGGDDLMNQAVSRLEQRAGEDEEAEPPQDGWTSLQLLQAASEFMTWAGEQVCRVVLVCRLDFIFLELQLDNMSSHARARVD